MRCDVGRIHIALQQLQTTQTNEPTDLANSVPIRVQWCGHALRCITLYMCTAKCFHALVWEYCVSNGKYWICICRSIRKLITKRVIIRIGENAPKMMSHYDWHGLWLSSCQVNTRGFQSRTDHIAHHSKHSRLIDSEFPIFFSLHISMFAFGFWSTEICKYCKWLVRGCFSQIELHKFYWYLFFFFCWVMQRPVGGVVINMIFSLCSGIEFYFCCCSPLVWVFVFSTHFDY